MSNDSWRTPPQVFNTLNEEFDFIADMACSDENKLCNIGFTEKDDSLSLDWAHAVASKNKFTSNRDYVWLNCPYSDPMPWVKKAAETQRNGLGVVMLLNSDTSVGWFAEAYKSFSEIRYVMADEMAEENKRHREYTSGRICFLDADGNPGKANNKPQAVLIFNPFKIAARVTTYITKKELYGEI
ncbi:MAG: phage N-6-adenine-methyltransferase [Shewanella sp.]